MGQIPSGLQPALRAATAGGSLVGDEFKITNTPTLNESQASVAVSASGQVAVVWEQRDPGTDTAQTYLSVSQENNLTIDTITGEVRLTESPDYETRTSYDFTVTASDGVLSDSIDVTLNVGDVNEAPFFDSGQANITVEENTDAGALIFRPVATDPEGDTLGYTVAGADADKVTVDPATGEVRLNEAPDYAAQPSYEFTVIASDGGLSGLIDVRVDVDEYVPGPIDLDPRENVVVENWRPGSSVGITLGTDPSGDGSLTLSLEPSELFSLDTATGQVTLRDGAVIDYESQTSHQLTATVTNDAGERESTSFTVSVEDVIEDSWDSGEFGFPDRVISTDGSPVIQNFDHGGSYVFGPEADEVIARGPDFAGFIELGGGDDQLYIDRNFSSSDLQGSITISGGSGTDTIVADRPYYNLEIWEASTTTGRKLYSTTTSSGPL